MSRPYHALPVTMMNLTQDFAYWVSQPDLARTQRFGQYFINKHLRPGYIWPEVFYADSGKAWTLLFGWINQNQLTSYPRALQ